MAPEPISGARNKGSEIMNIILMRTHSELNRVNKTFVLSRNYEGYLREECSIIDPIFQIEAEDLSQYNYCSIPEFSRLYFIRNIISVKTGLWRVECHVDVLSSYADEILNLNAIISATKVVEEELYMPSEVWKNKVKDTTTIKSFPYGLSETGEFILITAGGGSS